MGSGAKSYLHMKKVLLAVTVLAAAGVPFIARAADEPAIAPATPRAACGPGSRPESGMQGRVSAEDVESGRAAEGFACNAEQIGQFGNSGGFRVHRYVDSGGNECAFYDSTPMFPTSVPKAGANLTGVYVLDMSDPTKPVKTDNLLTPAMQSPHESLSLNTKRGLLAANMGNAFTYPGVVDVYDVSADCRRPVLKSSLPLGMLGHEGEFSPDGTIYWSSSAGAGTLTAVDVTDPANPVRLWTSLDYRFHGLNISEDGTRLYGAALGSGGPNDGMTILDVSQIHQRVPDPQARVISHTSWPNISIPQVPIPVTIGGDRYVVEIDEFAGGPIPSSEADADVGAARIIDIGDETDPKIVSEIRLEVNQPANRAAVMGDPGTTNPVAGYAGHYCAVPQRDDPGIVACSFILSGLRIFDIRDPLQPREIAYFNPPGDFGSSAEQTSFAMSAPAFVPERGEVWYADGNTGFYALRLTNGVWPFKAKAGPAAAAQVLGQTAVRPAAPPTTGAGSLPSTGGTTLWAVAGAALAAAARVTRRVTRAAR